MKKTPRDIIIFHKCTINDNHMMYGSWDMKRDGESFFWYYHFTHVYHKWQSCDVWFLRYEEWRTDLFVILDRFLTFYPTNNPKNQNFENLKKAPGDMIILHMCTINGNHVMYGPEIWSMTDKFFCHFGPFFDLLPH